MAKAKKEDTVVVAETEVAPVVVVTEDVQEVRVQTADELREELNAAIVHRDEFEKTCMTAAYLNKLSPKKRAQTQRKFGDLKLAVRYLQDGLADTL